MKSAELLAGIGGGLQIETLRDPFLRHAGLFGDGPYTDPFARGQAADPNYQQSQIQDLINKVGELINALRR